MLELRDIITLNSVTDKNVRFSDDKIIGQECPFKEENRC